MKRAFFGLATALIAGWWVSSARSELFQDGETVCFLGDSITAGGRYQGIILDFYLTRYPERTVHFVNAGRPGDTAGGSLTRLKDDVIDLKPGSVAIMFGMNDVSRSTYVANPDEKKRAAQQSALNGYRANLEKVVQRIRAEAGEPKLLLITPSPFDQTVVLDQENNQPGCNDGLGHCAEFVRELAGRTQAAVVDLHGPMTALNLERQKQDPRWTIIGGDRVHPGPPGHLMMAWLFLKAQGATPVVSRVAVDASAGRAVEAVNAEVTELRTQPGAVAFRVLAKALPFPIDPAASALLPILPIEQDLNQEVLSVRGLAAGRYALKIDGVEAGHYAAQELAAGINLAFNPATPQFKQAQTVAQHNARRRDAEAQARRLMNTRRWMESHYHVNPDDPAAVQAHYDRFEDKTEYNAAMALNYIRNWPQHGSFLEQAENAENEALAARKPVPREYELAAVLETQVKSQPDKR